MNSHVVYYVFDADDWPLYVGVTSNLTARLSAHMSGGGFWTRSFSYIATSEWMDAGAAYELEALEISELGPYGNTQGNTARQRLLEEERRDQFSERYRDHDCEWVLAVCEQWLEEDTLRGFGFWSFPTDLLALAHDRVQFHFAQRRAEYAEEDARRARRLARQLAAVS